MKMQSRITLGLVAAGFVAGAVIGVVITFIGKIVTGAPPADLANHVWNAVAFGTIGAVMAPFVTWSAMRRVPLWRAVAEPLLGGIAGAAVGALIGSGIGFLFLAPIGAVAAVARLERVYREPQRLVSAGE